MRVLYHYPFCPFSRKVRFFLSEKRLDFVLELEKFWDKNDLFLQINPLGQVPVLIDLNGIEICDSNAITEYLEETYLERNLIGENSIIRSEVRRLVGWFDGKFSQQISMTLLWERAIKRFAAQSNKNAVVNRQSSIGKNLDKSSSFPDPAVIRKSKDNLGYHLDYINWLTERRNWLAGDNFSLADICAACHLSIPDYFGDIEWDFYENAKIWYSKIKSRPSFRSFLSERLPGILPSENYANLDF